MNDLDTMDYLIIGVGIMFVFLASLLSIIQFDSILFVFFGLGSVVIYIGLTKGLTESIKRFAQ